MEGILYLYEMAVKTAKRDLYTASIASASFYPTQLFWVIWLLNSERTQNIIDQPVLAYMDKVCELKGS